MDMQKIYSMCLQGNILNVIEYLKTLEDKSSDIVMLEKQYEDRFLSDNKTYEVGSDDSWIEDVVNCYFRYFRSVLTNNSVEDSEKNLIMNLSKLANINQDSNLDEIESVLENIFREKGYSFLGGVTPPYRGPYIWKDTLKREFNVSLPESEQAVTVCFISDFLMLSWIHFATMGKHWSGGWAKPEGMYYIDNGSEPIDTNSTRFQVRFLKHEAQHLSDYKQFPNLNARNLEYRAKLVELIYNSQPHDLIEQFLNQSKNDKCLPHPFAAYSIIRNLSSLIFAQEYVYTIQQWRNIKTELISSSASELFFQNNKNLLEAGNETEGVI
jgi:hypothetical protein